MDGLTARKRMDVSIVGLGYRGVSVLERLSAQARNNPQVLLTVTIVDSLGTGEGLHVSVLPDYYRLNTIAAQICLRPDSLTLPASEASDQVKFPSFLEFCSSILPKEVKVHVEDFVPRAFLGMYLKAFLQNTLNSAPENLKVEIRSDEVTQINRNGNEFVLKVTTGADVSANHVIVCTGHGLQSMKQSIQKHDELEGVIIRGLGLSALDKVLDFTIGRGGQFERDINGKLTYICSGKEPKIVLQSRSGLPFRARPRGLSTHQSHLPMFLTKKYLQSCINKSKDGMVSFSLDVLPAMLAEMKLAWREFETPNNKYRQDIIEVQSVESSQFNWQAVDSILKWEKENSENRELESLLAINLPKHVSISNYSSWFKSFLADDLSESQIGVPNSKRKVVGEIWRDLRGFLRLYLSQDVLRHEEREHFYLTFNTALNRLVTGPQLERTEELLTLIDQNIVEVLHPNVRLTEVPNLCRELPGSVFEELKNELVYSISNDLHAMKILDRRLVVDSDNCVLDINGHPIFGLWALGPPVEGSKYYNHYVPSPGKPSQAMEDADRVAYLITQFGK
jgi:FAD-NAD(P)-binding